MYDAEQIRRYYDSFGEREWDRFGLNSTARVNYHIHLHYLQRYVRQGDAVLDVGAGPGRFTIELAKLGARVRVGDLSPVQLDLNRQRVSEAGYESAVVGRQIVDIVDLSDLHDAQFDVVVCYGGPLSYVFDRARDAVRELRRITKPGGYLLVSVMCLFGTIRAFLPAILGLARQHGIRRALEEVIETGDLSGSLNRAHPMHLYRSAELLSLLSECSIEIVAASAANFLSTAHEACLGEPVAEDEIWQAVLRAEVEACSQPGALDGGTHIIVVGRRPE